jgi:hypothetical protein
LLKRFCPQKVEADDLDSDVELNSSFESEGNTERLSEHACEIFDVEADEKRSLRKSHLVLFWQK